MAPQSSYKENTFVRKIQLVETIDFTTVLDRLHNDRLKELYLVKGWSARRTSDEIGCSHSTVLCKLKKQGVSIRNEHSPVQRRGQIGYGKRIVNGNEIQNQTEMRMIEKIKQLRDDGFSYHKIAAIFNSMGVQTKKRGAKWHATTVMNLLNSHENNNNLNRNLLISENI